MEREVVGPRRREHPTARPAARRQASAMARQHHVAPASLIDIVWRVVDRVEASFLNAQVRGEIDFNDGSSCCVQCP
eukprot:2515698-Rhodomonas_salina.8